MAIVVCLSGKIASGKSSVTETLSDHLGWKRTGFGDYLRAQIMAEGGDPSSRELQQDRGQKKVDADAEGFCREVLEFGRFRPGDNILVDGVRHTSILELLRKIVVPQQVKLIFLAVGDEVQKARVLSRADSSDLTRAESHIVEADMTESLPAQADLIVDAALPLATVIDQCAREIGVWTGGQVTWNPAV